MARNYSQFTRYREIGTLSIVVVVELFNHRDQLLFLQHLSQLFGYSSQINQGYLSSAFNVEKSEGLQCLFNRISLSIFLLHYLYVILISNPSAFLDIEFSSQLDDLGLFDIKSQGSEDDFEFVISDVGCFVGIEEIKGLFDLYLLV